MEQLLPWERLLKSMIWMQLGDIKKKRILDFGSGLGVTANKYAKENYVTAIEPSEESVRKRWSENKYEQIIGGLDELKKLENESFDIVFCHNVLEYASDREWIIKELHRVLRQDGRLSVVKHNRLGRIMMEAVLHNNFENVNALLDGKEKITSKFGTIQYYEDSDIVKWCNNDLSVLKVYGIRTFWDLQHNQDVENDEDWQKKMLQIEMRVSEMEQFRAIAFFHHLILEKWNRR